MKYCGTPEDAPVLPGLRADFADRMEWLAIALREHAALMAINQRRKPMAEAVGDVLSLPTSRGQAEARRMGHTEAGESRWCIRHPWGTETFYGTAEQVMAHMAKRVAEGEAPATQRPPLKNADTERRV